MYIYILYVHIQYYMLYISILILKSFKYICSKYYVINKLYSLLISKNRYNNSEQKWMINYIYLYIYMYICVYVMYYCVCH